MNDSTSQSENNSRAAAFILRPGTVEDSYAVFQVFEQTLADLSRRLGSTTPTSWQDPDALDLMWRERRSLYEHLAATAEHFWIAERDGRPLAFARSVLRDGLRQLTELFVVPGEQSSGMGSELLKRVFPGDGTIRRSLIATPDTRAQTLYVKAGVYPRFPVCYFGRQPELVTVKSDLSFEPIIASVEYLDHLASIDLALLGHRRQVDHIWLLGNRQGYLYRRNEQPVGFGYVGLRNGPFGLLDADDFPAVLAHSESEAARHKREFGVEVPMINKTAVDYLLDRGCRIDGFLAMFMSDEPFGRFENYIVTSPPFFL